MAPRRSATDAVLAEVRARGLGYPGAHTKSPWPGHLDLAVNDKTFAYLSLEGEPFGIPCKLPRSAAMALLMPFATPTGYGLGKSGWVSARFAPGEVPPVDLILAWLDESYRAQAPKKLVAVLDRGGGPEASTVPSPSATPTRAARTKAKPARPAKASARAKPATRRR